MVGEVEKILADTGLSLPEAAAPLAAYVPWVRTGNLLFVSGQLPMGPDGLATGTLTSADHADGAPPAGSNLAYAKAAAQMCALNVLAHVKSAAGELDSVARVVKLTGFVSSDGSFRQHPMVINGASELMATAFGNAGQHARAAVGSSSLPLGAICEVEGVFELV
ncbi:MAG: RidA family protein [Pseudomonadota bacterium]